LKSKTNRKDGRIEIAAANLFPGYFALVMATGIISIAAFQLKIKGLSAALKIL